MRILGRYERPCRAEIRESVEAAHVDVARSESVHVLLAARALAPEPSST